MHDVRRTTLHAHSARVCAQHLTPPILDLLPTELWDVIVVKLGVPGLRGLLRVSVGFRKEALRALQAKVGVPPPLLRFRYENTFHGYAIPYTGTAKQTEAILGVIRTHNTLSLSAKDTNEWVRKSEYEGYELLGAGAELVGVRAVSLARPWMDFCTVLFCCNTGASARKFLDWEVGRALNEPAITVYECHSYARFAQWFLKEDYGRVERFDQQKMVGKAACDTSQTDVYTTRHERDSPTKFEYHSENKPGDILCDELDRYCGPYV